MRNRAWPAIARLEEFGGFRELDPIEARPLELIACSVPFLLPMDLTELLYQSLLY